MAIDFHKQNCDSLYVFIALFPLQSAPVGFVLSICHKIMSRSPIAFMLLNPMVNSLSASYTAFNIDAFWK